MNENIVIDVDGPLPMENENLSADVIKLGQQVDALTRQLNDQTQHATADRQNGQRDKNAFAQALESLRGDVKQLRREFDIWTAPRDRAKAQRLAQGN